MNSRIITVLGVLGVFTCGWFSHEFFGGLSATREMVSAAEPTVAVGEVAMRPVNPVEWYIGHVIFQRVGDWYEKRGIRDQESGIRD